MTEKEKIRRWIHFQDTDRVPWQINFTTQMGDMLMEQLNLRNGTAGGRTGSIRRYVPLDDFLGNHIAYARNRGQNSLRETSPGIWRDEWGVEWDRRIDHDIGTPVNCPLESGRITDLRLPDPDDPERYAHVPAVIEANPGRYILAKFSYSLFERAWSLRGMENLLVDLGVNTGFVHELLRAICDFDIAVLRNFRTFPIDGVYFGDDWGSQKAMLMSPDMWRSLIKPYLKELYEETHKQGWDVFIHCCGQITPILDDLVGIGLNVFNPFQPEVMDIPSLMKRYSRRLAFYGSLSIQKTLPFGTEEDVRGEVLGRLALARAYGGLIVSPSHDMPPDIPVHNVVAMRDALRGQ